MKRLAFVAVFAFFALTVPAFASEVPEVPEAVPAPPAQEQVEQPDPLLKIIKPFPVPVPYCSALDGTSCPYAGNTQTCRDVCGYSVSCTCTAYSPNPNYRYWRCGWQC